MEAELKRAEADTNSWVKYAKEGKQKQASLRLEMGKRARDLKLKIPPVETPVKRPKRPKVDEKPKVMKSATPVPVISERFDVDPEQAANLAAQR